jgi:hypothetical protein
MGTFHAASVILRPPILTFPILFGTRLVFGAYVPSLPSRGKVNSVRYLIRYEGMFPLPPWRGQVGMGGRT